MRNKNDFIPIAQIDINSKGEIINFGVSEYLLELKKMHLQDANEFLETAKTTPSLFLIVMAYIDNFKEDSKYVDSKVQPVSSLVRKYKKLQKKQKKKSCKVINLYGVND